MIFTSQGSPAISYTVKKLVYMNFMVCSQAEIIWFSDFLMEREWSKPERKTPIQYAAAATAKSLQSCPVLCCPIDCSPPGSPVPGVLQARTLEWVAISFFSAWKWKVKVKSLNHVRLLATPWTAAFQASPSMGFSRREYWSGVPSPSHIQPIWIECYSFLTFKF